jgi:uncharacterized protein (DUF983 family)
MKVTRGEIIARGLTNRCPNCGERGLFVPGSIFKTNKACTHCALPIERDEGSYLGAMSLNYGFTVIGYVTPLSILAAAGAFSWKTFAIAAVAGALLLPILFYRSSRSWWLMNYYFFLPQHLPANQEKADSSG